MAWLGASGATVEAHQGLCGRGQPGARRRHLRRIVARRHDLGQDVEVLGFHDDVRPAMPILTRCLAVVDTCDDDQPGVTQSASHEVVSCNPIVAQWCLLCQWNTPLAPHM